MIMRLSLLEELTKYYDNKKAWNRRIFGDDPQIKALKKFVNIEKQRIKNAGSVEDPFVSYNDFYLFTHLGRRGLVDLSDKYLDSGRLSADIFRYWNPSYVVDIDTDELQTIVKRNIGSSRLTSISKPTVGAHYDWLNAVFSSISAPSTSTTSDPSASSAKGKAILRREEELEHMAIAAKIQINAYKKYDLSLLAARPATNITIATNMLYIYQGDNGSIRYKIGKKDVGGPIIIGGEVEALDNRLEQQHFLTIIKALQDIKQNKVPTISEAATKALFIVILRQLDAVTEMRHWRDDGMPYTTVTQTSPGITMR